MAAALALIAHMSGRESQDVEAKNGTAIPALNGTQDAWVKSFPKWNCKIFVDAATNYAVTYPVSRSTNSWADREADFLNPAFGGEKPVSEAAKKLAAFMNDALNKERR